MEVPRMGCPEGDRFCLGCFIPGAIASKKESPTGLDQDSRDFSKGNWTNFSLFPSIGDGMMVILPRRLKSSEDYSENMLIDFPLTCRISRIKPDKKITHINRTKQICRIPSNYLFLRLTGYFYPSRECNCS